VGQIAATGIPLFVANTAEQSEWIARPEWATGEHTDLTGTGASS
jgi:hypothetical protein